MARKMPPGGWPIEVIAAIVGADAKKLRAVAIARSMSSDLTRGRFVTTEKGVEWLLRQARDWGGDAASAYDRWFEQPSTDEVVRTLAAPPSSPSAVAPPSADGGTPQKIQSAVAALEDQQSRSAASLAQAVVDLLGIVAAQQQQIIQLARQVDAATITQVQSRIHEQASEHLHRVLLTSAKALKELGNPVGQVTAGTVIHKGSVTITRSSSLSQEESTRTAREANDALKIDVGAEMKGLAARLAGAALKVKVDTAQFEKRTQELARQSQASSTESFTGELEIQYQGVSVSIGK